MNFGEALTLIKAGHKMARAGWNGKGMWIEIQRPDANSKMTLPYLFLNYPHGDVVPWLASQTDLLQEDWMQYVEPENDGYVAVSEEEYHYKWVADKKKKPHWTQTPAGKRKLAARKKARK